MTSFRRLFAILLLAAPLLAQSKLNVPTIAYEQYKLPNGLQVLMVEDHRLPLVGVDLWYHVGPVKEKEGRTGFAHLFEHMMFEGSKHVGEKAHFKYLEAAGASDINGTTDFDRTNYFETLPANQLELALWLESDRMGFLLDTLDRTKLANQRDVVRNERRQSVEGQPYGIAEELMFHELYPKGHPYYASVIGSHADVEAARLNDVREFFKQYYTPNNATLVITGDISKPAAKALVEKYFGPIPQGPPVEAVNIKTPPITQEKRLNVTDQVQLPKVLLGWLAPAAFAPGDAEMILANQILGGGKSSRLYRKLVYEQQIAQDATCFQESLALGSPMGCEITAKPNVTPEQIEKATNDVMADFLANGATQAELDRARTTIEARKIRNLERLGGFGGVADMLNYYNQYVGDPGYLPKDIARYDAVTPESLLATAKSTLQQNQRVTMFCTPGKKVVDDVPRSPENTDADVKVEPEYTAEFDKAQAWRATAPKAGPLPKLQLPVPAEFKLDNGLKVYLVPDHSLPLLAMRVMSLGGSDANTHEKSGVAGFTAAMLTEGTANRTAPQIADETDKLGATLNTGATFDNAAVSMSVLSNNTDPAIDLLSDVVLHPKFDAKETDRIRKERQTGLIQLRDDPFQLAIRVGNRAEFGTQSPYGEIELGTPESLKSTTSDDLTNFWKSHYTPANSALIFSGDITEAKARELAKKYFGAWTAKGSATEPPKTVTAQSRKIVLVDQPGAPQSVILAYGVGVPRSNPDYPAITVMNTMLGGLFSSRINMNLREKNGFTYGAFSAFSWRRGAGPFFAGSQVRTDVTAPAARELFAELDGIRTRPLTADELKMSKDSVIRSLPGDFETRAAVAAGVGNIWTYSLPLDYYRQIEGKIEAVTAEDTSRVAKQYVQPDKLLLVTIGDKAKIESGLQELKLGPIELWTSDAEPMSAGSAAGGNKAQ
ncbi:peptidase M16-like protein [Candidatus Koribacter versatilis Ellin345]|uniref:Peptidase M16-like protein n=1 Tax=Koribacter versatilis (strain Ellin345) TaxID=204669 RepID=Q1II94_KORVE|nr:pitrilysin family protein [Candidatus Koribacter versatilis]ABF43406.1 peptidase M16-like protein [Candidatus Koribacter versatilis Ellin345]